MWSLKSGSLLWQVKLYWSVGLSTTDLRSFKTGGLGWHWSLKVILFSDIAVQWNLSWQTTCLERPQIFGRRTYIQYNWFCHHRDHLSSQTTFLWPMGWSIKTGSTAPLFLVTHILIQFSRWYVTVQWTLYYLRTPMNMMRPWIYGLTYISSWSQRFDRTPNHKLGPN